MKTITAITITGLLSGCAWLHGDNAQLPAPGVDYVEGPEPMLDANAGVAWPLLPRMTGEIPPGPALLSINDRYGPLPFLAVEDDSRYQPMACSHGATAQCMTCGPGASGCVCVQPSGERACVTARQHTDGTISIGVQP